MSIIVGDVRYLLLMSVVQQLCDYLFAYLVEVWAVLAFSLLMSQIGLFLAEVGASKDINQ